MSLARSLASIAALAALVFLSACEKSDSVQLPTAEAKAKLTKAGIPNYSRVVESGAKTRIWTTANLNPDCTSRGDYKMGIVQAPAHGQLTLERGEEYPTYPSTHPRANCNKQKVPFAAVTYTSQPGYTGEDFLAVDFSSSDNGASRAAFFLTVRTF